MVKMYLECGQYVVKTANDPSLAQSIIMDHVSNAMLGFSVTKFLAFVMFQPSFLGELTFDTTY